MKQLNENLMAQHSPSDEEIHKNYNNQVFGTETPNVVQIIKGGGSGKQAKKSSLRKKTVGVISNPQISPPEFNTNNIKK